MLNYLRQENLQGAIMPKNYLFKTDSQISLTELLEVSNKIQDSYPITAGFGSTGTKFAELSDGSSLPNLGDYNGIEFEEIVVSGFLSSASVAWDFFSDIEVNAKSLKGIASRIALSCKFKEKPDAQDSAYSVSVSLILLNAKLSVAIHLNGARLDKTPEYWDAFYRKLIAEFNLPLEISGADLVHTQSGNVRILDSHSGCLPGGFVCDLLESDLSSSIADVKNGLGIFSMSSSPEFSWRITCNDIREGDVSFLSDMSHFPADSFDVNLDFSVVGIEGLDCLIAWCEDDDVSTTRICSFDLPDTNSTGEFLVETTRSGHKLLLSLPSDERVREIEHKLDVTFDSV